MLFTPHQDVIPHMAQEYGFEYELVTYKWPTWLHKQTEKQRIIWAYKILFLDVIFPLSLEKVRFSWVKGDDSLCCIFGFSMLQLQYVGEASKMYDEYLTAGYIR